MKRLTKASSGTGSRWRIISRRQPVFLSSLSPVKPLPDAPLIVKHMCRAAEIAGVGPMAAIAGAISLYVANDLLKYSKELIVENGGDIYIAGTQETNSGYFCPVNPVYQENWA